MLRPELLEHVDWATQADRLNTHGYTVIPSVLTPARCHEIRALYESDDTGFRSVIKMDRYNFGRGEYKYFSYPLPSIIDELRRAFFPPLAAIANDWAVKMGIPDDWPPALDQMLSRCHDAGQMRPTPLLLNYEVGDYNCLHQDIYGDIHFPLQVIVMLSDPDVDYAGGELVLVEQRPRMQSRPMVIRPGIGDAVIVPVRERPVEGKRGFYRVQMRHGVSEVRKGQRRTLGLIFHDAA